MKPRDFRDVIGLWPSIPELADELDEKPWTVEKWRTRNRIPDRVWKRLLDSAARRKLPVTADTLVSLASETAA